MKCKVLKEKPSALMRKSKCWHTVVYLMTNPTFANHYKTKWNIKY